MTRSVRYHYRLIPSLPVALRAAALKRSRTIRYELTEDLAGVYARSAPIRSTTSLDVLWPLTFDFGRHVAETIREQNI